MQGSWPCRGAFLPEAAWQEGFCVQQLLGGVFPSPNHKDITNHKDVTVPGEDV